MTGVVLGLDDRGDRRNVGAVARATRVDPVTLLQRRGVGGDWPCPGCGACPPSGASSARGGTREQGGASSLHNSGGNSVSERITGTRGWRRFGRATRHRFGERRTSTPRMPTCRAPSMSCVRLSPIAAASAAGMTSRSAASKMRVGLHVAVFGRRYGGRDQALELEVARRCRAPVAVRDEADGQPLPRDLTQRRGHVIMQLEIAAGGPLGVDLLRARINARTVTPMPVMMAAVYARWKAPPRRCGRGPRRAQPGGRRDHAASNSSGSTAMRVSHPEPLISPPPGRSAQVDQREVDIEENRASHAPAAEHRAIMRPRYHDRGAIGLEHALGSRVHLLAAASNRPGT